MESKFKNICMFEIKADSLQLVKKTVALPLYSRDAELNAFISSAKRDLTAKDFRDAGFEELVDGDETPVSGLSFGRMDDNAQCYIYQHDEFKRENWDEKLDIAFKLPSDLVEKKVTVRRKVKKHFRKDVNLEVIWTCGDGMVMMVKGCVWCSNGM